MKHVARLALLTLIFMIWQAPAIDQGPVVRAVLFFSPTCPHCHKVINEDLPVIFRRFGGDARVWFDQQKPREEVAFYLVSNGQLEILLVDASLPAGNSVFNASTEALRIPDDRGGVPRLVVADSMLLGSFEIPNILPTLIEAGLAEGGIDWPDIEGLAPALAAFPTLQPLAGEEPEGEPVADAGTEPEAEAERVADPGTEPVPEMETAPDSVATEASPEASPETGATGAGPETMEAAGTEAAETTEGPAATVTEADSAGVAEAAPGETDLSMIAVRRPGMLEMYRRDPVGNGFSVAVLIGMLLSLFAVYSMSRQPGTAREPSLAIPVLSLVGILVAGYLSYIESTGAQAVCGPVGDCNTVNQSEYAVLFGVPVGVLGLAGYVAIVGAWLMSRRGSGAAADWAKVALLALAALGTLFSVYLTFLEPFVIGATCAWCLTSAVVMTLLMLLAARPGFEALERMRAT
jgi:uncharacterized membrane protein